MTTNQDRAIARAAEHECWAQRMAAMLEALSTDYGRLRAAVPLAADLGLLTEARALLRQYKEAESC